MPATLKAKVLVVGAGPVGLTLALDLAQRGIEVTVVECRAAHQPPPVKCNQISARSMEIFRRLGLSHKLRALGLPADYPNDVVSRITATGIELARVPIPARGERFNGARGPDTSWPTPEHTHRINQIYFEPVLSAHAASQPRIRILNRTMVDGFTQDEDGIVADAHGLDSGKRITIAADYLVGCDGGKSMVRRSIGARLDGMPALQRVQSTYIRAPDLLRRLPGKPAWLYYSLNPRRCGMMMAVDGREKWLIHNYLYRGEQDFDAVDRDGAIREILGLGPDFRYDVISKEDWTSRRLVAEKFRDRRAFICGDAAHLWVPHGGYGMNAGIADAANLSWMLAAVLNGWAPPALLDAYEAERHPVIEQTSQLITDIAQRVMMHRREISADIERDDAVGEAARTRIGSAAYDIDVTQQCCAGLNFGYCYENSPIVAHDDETPPAYRMGEFTPSSVPGCRTPHLWLGEGRSLYDTLGTGFTLIRTDPRAEVDGIFDVAARRQMPLAVLDLDTPEARELYSHKLTLVRPDQHVAWRGDAAPASPAALIDRVCGVAASSHA
ncbi:MAG TPA: FAD-dependent oxidoreductase [Pseudolabrys sp.]|nr:FAD-dependent oxidoreductase [Pseudolabrys sp.]